MGGGGWGGGGKKRESPSCARAWELLFTAPARAAGRCAAPAVPPTLRCPVGGVFLYPSPSSTISVPGAWWDQACGIPSPILGHPSHTPSLLAVAPSCGAVPWTLARSQCDPLCVVVGAVDFRSAACITTGLPVGVLLPLGVCLNLGEGSA